MLKFSLVFDKHHLQNKYIAWKSCKTKYSSHIWLWLIWNIIWYSHL